MLHKPICEDITVAISMVGNLDGLKCCLSGLASGQCMPKALNLRMEGDIPGVNDYYFEQLLCAFRFWGVEVNIQLAHARGIHATRDAQVDNCKTTWMVMLDDDVMPDFALLSAYWTWINSVGKPGQPSYDGSDIQAQDFLMVQGSKPDLNNRRGYADFEAKPVPFPGPSQAFNFNVPHTTTVSGLSMRARWLFTRFCDPGNMLLNVPLCRQMGIMFNPFKDIVRRAGGEDTLFAVQAIAQQARRVWLPAAFVWHLEKPASSFRLTEHAYRKEALLRSAEQLGVFDSGELTREQFSASLLAWEKLEHFSD